MKRYLKNILIALLGRNPYQAELDKATEEYEKRAAMVKHLDEMRFSLEEKLAEAYRKVKELEKSVASYQNLTENLRQRVTDKDIAIDRMTREHRDSVVQMNQEHVENTKRLVSKCEQLMQEHKSELEQIREAHNADMDELRAKHERDTIDRHEEYEEKMTERDEKIAALREALDATLERLQTVNRAIAHDLVAQSLLDKTNNGLEDLIQAMQSGDVEKMMQVTQYLDWSSHLVRIAQAHLNVLRRKNELVERLHFAESKGDDDNVNYE